MYRYDLTGFAYGMSQPLDLTWIGYNYVHGNSPVHTQTVNRNKDLYKISYMSQYYRSAKRLVLIFGPINRYCNGFSLYYQGHYGNNFKNGGNVDGYEIQVTCTNHPLS